MKTLHIDANADGQLDSTEVKFEAGKLAGLSFDNKQALLPLIVKHKNEWAVNRNSYFQKLSELFGKHDLKEHADNFQRRSDDLAIHVKVGQFDTDKPAYFMHPLMIIGGVQKGGLTLTLTYQDVIDIMKVTSTEVVPVLKGNSFTEQLNGVVDTILNRSIINNGDVRGVINKRWAFSDINSSQKTAYGSVQNVPWSRVSSRIKNGVKRHLIDRENGSPSSVDGNVNYANPYYLNGATSSTKKWVAEVYEQAKKTGQIYGAGKAIHVHGTPAGVRRAPEFNLVLPSEIYN